MLPQTPSCNMGPTSKGGEGRGREGKGREGRGMEGREEEEKGREGREGRKGEGRGEWRAPNHTFWLRHRGEGLRDKDGRKKKGEGSEGGDVGREFGGYCLQLHCTNGPDHDIDFHAHKY